ncbi:hypothetical protein AALD01_02740 [Oscillospiraceae bacterium 21-37]|jgi:hypothetical protein|nr:hypothetical protein [Dysosmobacter sp.]
MERAVNSRKKSSMTMIVEGREVALHFSDEPNTQIVVKIKQALLGTYLAAKE